MCSACQAEPPPHDGVRAAVAYGDVARRLALRLKYGRRIGIAETLAIAMARVTPPDIDLLVPVPLHRWRLWARGFNQAALIAVALGRIGNRPVARDALLRRRATAPLRGMNPRERRRAVADAFAVRDAAAGAIAGRHIGLVDDVYTTGATANACTRALRGAGAAHVSILCWARVLADDAADRPAIDKGPRASHF